jgi:hypothetical protein
MIGSEEMSPLNGAHSSRARINAGRPGILRLSNAADLGKINSAVLCSTSVSRR